MTISCNGIILNIHERENSFFPTQSHFSMSFPLFLLLFFCCFWFDYEINFSFSIVHYFLCIFSRVDWRRGLDLFDILFLLLCLIFHQIIKLYVFDLISRGVCDWWKLLLVYFFSFIILCETNFSHCNDWQLDFFHRVKFSTERDKIKDHFMSCRI